MRIDNDHPYGNILLLHEHDVLITFLPRTSITRVGTDPYKFTVTSIVGEGLVAQPQTAPLCPLGTSPTGRPLPKRFRYMSQKREADNAFP